MDTNVQQLSELIRQYEFRKPFQNGHLAPRKGFYLINEVRHQLIGALSDIPVAKALWSPTEDSFCTDFEVDIQLVSLYEPSSKGPTRLSYSELIGAKIQIYYGGVEEIVTANSCTSSYWVKWDIVANSSL